MGANAQTSVFTFTAGQVLTAAQLNATARTGVPVFATTADRDAAFGGTGEKTLAEGQTCYIEAAPKRLQVYNGSAWIDFEAEWTAFTPTWNTGYTRGNGTTDSKYVRIGKTVICSIRETLGSTSSVSGALSYTLPITARATAALNGSGVFVDAATQIYPMLVYPENTTQVYLYVINATTTYGGSATTSATIPFTWGTNDFINVTVVYEAA